MEMIYGFSVREDQYHCLMLHKYFNEDELYFAYGWQKVVDLILGPTRYKITYRGILSPFYVTEYQDTIGTVSKSYRKVPIWSAVWWC